MCWGTKVWRKERKKSWLLLFFFFFFFFFFGEGTNTSEMKCTYSKCSGTGDFIFILCFPSCNVVLRWGGSVKEGFIFFASFFFIFLFFFVFFFLLIFLEKNPPHHKVSEITVLKIKPNRPRFHRKCILDPNNETPKLVSSWDACRS